MKGVSKAFPGVQALTNIDFDLKCGEVHALVGENGAGKSTLMKILTGVYDMDAGHIFIDGHAAHMRNVHEARQLGIAIKFKSQSQFLKLTVARTTSLEGNPRRASGFVVDQTLFGET